MATTSGGGAGDGERALIFGKYRQGNLLGRGSFSKVYRATNVETGKDVALKVMSREQIVRAGLEGHVEREVAVMRRVQHPNVVQLYELMATRTKIYIAMELMQGGDLFGLLDEGPLDEDTARKYFRQLISAVGFCHDRGVYHRDIKPENLLLDDHGELKVSDFGLSAVASRMRGDGMFHTLSGTPAYIAPEMLLKKGYDAAKSDIWSCGVVLYVLNAGFLPFQGTSLAATIRKIYRAEFVVPRWFSPRLTRLIRRILNPNPERRYTIRDIISDPWFRGVDVDDDDFDPTPIRRSLSSSSNMHLSASDDGDDGETPSTATGTGAPPAALTAFDVISFSPCLDLSGLFEDKGQEMRFVSGAPVSAILARFEEVAQQEDLYIRVKGCQVNLEGKRESIEGPLAVTAEVFELTPDLVVVEIKKVGGDTEEYEDFCNEVLRPRLVRELIYDKRRRESEPMFSLE